MIHNPSDLRLNKIVFLSEIMQGDITRKTIRRSQCVARVLEIKNEISIYILKKVLHNLFYEHEKKK